MSQFWSRAILHVDMDAFFASVEVLDNPSLKGKPVIVGGPAEHRGVVCAASYEARRFGVHSAMPMVHAVRRCPNGVFICPRAKRYGEVSREIHAIFNRFSPEVEPISVDEAFIDVTGSQRLFGPAPEIGQQIKDAIRTQIGLTASVGCAPVKFVAKIASDLEKPDGFVIIREEDILDRLAPLPIGRLWGVGAQTEKIFHKLHIHTIGDLRAWPQEEIEERFGASGQHLYELAWGRDARRVETAYDAKSYSHETTFERDVTNPEELSAALLELADSVAARMRRDRVVGRVLFIKIRYDDFSTVTRQIHVEEPTAVATTMWEGAVRLMLQRTEAGVRPVRLVGIGMSDILDEADAIQHSLFGKNERLQRIEAIERATDRIRAKIGPDAIARAIHMSPLTDTDDVSSTKHKKRKGGIHDDPTD